MKNSRYIPLRCEDIQNKEHNYFESDIKWVYVCKDCWKIQINKKKLNKALFIWTAWAVATLLMINPLVWLLATIIIVLSVDFTY